MNKDDIIFAQLDRIEKKLDGVVDSAAANKASIGFLKVSVTSLFTAIVTIIGFFIKYKQ